MSEYDPNEPGYDPGPCYCDHCGEPAEDCECDEDRDEPFGPDYDYGGGRIDFADPGGRSALRAETRTNPRIHPCPNCGEPNRLTVVDVQRGYQCDACADRAERGQFFPDGY